MENSSLIKYPLYNLRYIRELEIEHSENWFNEERSDKVNEKLNNFGILGKAFKVTMVEKETGLRFYLYLVNTTKEAIERAYRNNWRNFQIRFYPPEISEMEFGKLFFSD